MVTGFILSSTETNLFASTEKTNVLKFQDEWAPELKVEKTKNLESGLHSAFNTYLPFAPLSKVMGNFARAGDFLETISTVSSVN